ncbi:MAG: hypothetical protein AAB824_01225, partial [Patescibacteria group bacterium]
MDNANPQDGSKIVLHTMDDDLKKSAPVPSAPVSSGLSNVQVPPAPKALPSFVAPKPLAENKPATMATPPISSTSAIPQITIPEINPLKRRIVVISTFIAIVLVVFGLGVGLFFWIRSQSSPAPVATPTPSIEGSLSPSLSTPPEISLVYPPSVTTFDGAGAVIEYKASDDLSNVLASKLPLIAQEGKAIRILLRQTDSPEGPRFTYLSNVLKTMGVLVNSELSKIMANPGDLFVYEDGGNYRLGFVSSLS